MARTTPGADQTSGLESRQNSTYMKVLFYTFDYGLITAHTEGFEGDVIGTADFRTLHQTSESLVGSLTMVTTTKQMGQVSGTWSVTVKGYVIGNWDKSFHEWPDLVHDGDWVKIICVKNGVEHLLMVGRVDTHNLHLGVDANGGPDIQVSFSGRDLGAVAEDTPIYWNPFDPLHSNVAGIGMAKILGDNARIAGRPDEVVPNLLLGLTSGTTYGHPPKVPAGVFGYTDGPWTDGIDRTTFVSECRGKVYAPQILTAGNNPSVWSYATQWTGPMNEVWLDTLTTDTDYLIAGKGYLFMRERPFVNATDGALSPWFDLPHHTVSYVSLKSLAISRGRNRVNHVMVVGEIPSTFGGDAMALFPPALDEDSIGRYGLRRLERRTPYMAGEDEGGTMSFASEYRDWQNLVVSWNALNGEYWQGVAHGAELLPEIQIGSKVSFINGPPLNYGGNHGHIFKQDGGDTDKAMSFYVEAVQHTWNAGQAPVVETQLMVSRGFTEGERVDAVRAATRKWTRVGGDGSSILDIGDGYDAIEVAEDPNTGVA